MSAAAAAASSSSSSFASCPAPCRCDRSFVYCNDRGLASIPAGLPRGATTLYLQNNLVNSSGLPADLSSLLQVDMVYLYGNELEVFPSNLPRNVRELHLQENNIQTVSREALARLHRVERLHLDDNSISSVGVERGAFLECRSLRLLFLSRNHLSQVPERLPTGLEELRLDDNRIGHIDGEAFAGLASLRRLVLDGNLLSDGALSADTFRRLGSLAELSLTRNSLAAPPSGLPGASLQRLHLQENQLSRIPAGAFAGLGQLRRLDLSSNNLSRLQPGAFEGLDSLAQLLARNNPWRCDCAIEWVRRWLNSRPVNARGLMCQGPDEVRGMSIKDLAPESLSCSARSGGGDGARGGAGRHQSRLTKQQQQQQQSGPRLPGEASRPSPSDGGESALATDKPPPSQSLTESATGTGGAGGPGAGAGGGKGGASGKVGGSGGRRGAAFNNNDDGGGVGGGNFTMTVHPAGEGSVVVGWHGPPDVTAYQLTWSKSPPQRRPPPPPPPPSSPRGHREGVGSPGRPAVAPVREALVAADRSRYVVTGLERAALYTLCLAPLRRPHRARGAAAPRRPAGRAREGEEEEEEEEKKKGEGPAGPRPGLEGGGEPSQGLTLPLAAIVGGAAASVLLVALLASACCFVHRTGRPHGKRRKGGGGGAGGGEGSRIGATVGGTAVGRMGGEDGLGLGAGSFAGGCSGVGSGGSGGIGSARGYGRPRKQADDYVESGTKKDNSILEIGPRANFQIVPLTSAATGAAGVIGGGRPHIVSGVGVCCCRHGERCGLHKEAVAIRTIFPTNGTILYKNDGRNGGGGGSGGGGGVGGAVSRAMFMDEGAVGDMGMARLT
uniref:Leucine-rich repeat transmembrane protein FLRT1-like n=1 Tax=Petromyzon marinus TaxID=7757 RepID=A0AAJ7WKC2_PETMA|nr:leucine-rich repeat transmembrane protein FLRT1-like [Petromyzon marinus]